MKALKSWKLIISLYLVQPITIPIDPDTSAREEPIDDQRTRLLLIEGLRASEEVNEARTEPTPIATPAKLINGILDAKYLNPNNIIRPIIPSTLGSFNWYFYN